MATWIQRDTKRGSLAPRSPKPPGPHLPFFDAISQSSRDRFLARSTRQRVGRSDAVFLEGAELHHLFIVLSGSFKLVRQSVEGKELILELVDRGRIFGAVHAPVGSAAAARALEDSQLLVVPLGILRGAVAESPELGAELLRCSEERRRDAEALATRLAFASVPRRLSGLLLDISERSSGTLLFPLSQSEVAHCIGSSRETVCSLLNQFRRSGLLEISRGKIRVLDREGLEAVG